MLALAECALLVNLVTWLSFYYAHMLMLAKCAMMVTTNFVGLSSDLVSEDYLVNIGKLVTWVGSFTPSLLDI